MQPVHRQSRMSIDERREAQTSKNEYWRMQPSKVAILCYSPTFVDVRSIARMRSYVSKGWKMPELLDQVIRTPKTQIVPVGSSRPGDLSLTRARFQGVDAAQHTVQKQRKHDPPFVPVSVSFATVDKPVQFVASANGLNWKAAKWICKLRSVLLHTRTFYKDFRSNLPWPGNWTLLWRQDPSFS